MRKIYPEFMTAAHKAESEQEDRPGEGVQVRSAQSEGKDSIVSLRAKCTAASGGVVATETATSNL